MNKKIVHLPLNDDDSEDDDTANGGPSFISGSILNKLGQLNVEKFSHVITKQINAKLNEKYHKNEKKENNIIVPATDEGKDLSNGHTKLILKNNELTEEKSIKTNNDSPPIIILDDDNDDDIIFIEEMKEVNSKSNETFNMDEEEYYKEFMAHKETQPMKIKMMRMNRVEYFSLLPSKPLSTILDEVSQKFQIPVSDIIIYLNDILVDPRSTPKSLQLSVADIFQVLARNRTNSLNYNSLADTHATANDPNFVTIHLRDNTKKRLTIRINRFRLVRELAEYYAKKKEVDVEKLILEFDSDVMLFDKKIDSFDMDDDDQIDVTIKS